MEQTTIPPIKEKTCSKCGRTLPIYKFGIHSRAKDGHQNYCMECKKKAAAENYRKRKSLEAGIILPNSGTNPALAEFTPRQLIEELRSRGYKGTLTYTHEIKL